MLFQARKQWNNRQLKDIAKWSRTPVGCIGANLSDCSLNVNHGHDRAWICDCELSFLIEKEFGDTPYPFSHVRSICERIIKEEAMSIIEGDS